MYISSCEEMNCTLLPVEWRLEYSMDKTQTFLLGLFLSAVVGLFIRLYYFKKEQKGFRAWVNLYGKEFEGYCAPIQVIPIKHSDFPLLAAPKDEKERHILPSTSLQDVLGAPVWRMAGEDRNGNKQIVMLDAVYTLHKVDRITAESF